MSYDPEIHHRRSIRLRHHDYARRSAYFVTICTRGRQRIFGEVVAGRMVLSSFGAVVEAEWVRSARMREDVRIGEFIVMPDHFHGLVVHHGRGDPGRGSRPGPRPNSLGALIAGFKAAVTSRLSRMSSSPGMPVWQRNYHERVVRNEAEYRRIEAYIRDNPRQWTANRFRPPPPDKRP